MRVSVSGLVDLAEGAISREIFTDATIYKRELETVFARAWLFVGHESLIPNRGDYFTSRMGEESVILCRDKTGKVHVFLNSCRHRGMKVCRYDHGNTSLFTCPYHSWTYGTDGQLKGVPLYNSLYQPTLDRSKWSLIEPPKLALYKGTVWASWDPDAPEFETYLGDAIEHLDHVLDCRDGRPGGSEVIGVHKWVVPANWKFAAENFLGDTYHNPSHRSVDLIGIGPGSRMGKIGRRNDNELEKAQHVWVSFPGGHGVHSALEPANNEYSPTFLSDPDIDEYFSECHRQRRARLGEKSRLLAFTGTIFPNTSYHGRQPRALCVWHPHGPTEAEAWRFFLVDADAPTKVKDYLRHYYMRYSGPAGMTEQDDMENWLYATRASMGTIAKRYPLNYQQSMGACSNQGLVPGDVSMQITEQNARNYYRRWVTYMEDASWSTLLGAACST